jgi:hypothetical protein
MKRPRLTARELEAILAAVSNVDHRAMADDFATKEEGEQFLDDLEKGIAKLSLMLDTRLKGTGK